MSLTRRQRITLPEPARRLISCVTGLQAGHEYFETYETYVAHHLFDVNGSGGGCWSRNKVMDSKAIDSRFVGLAEKFSIRGQDTKADAIKRYLQQLRQFTRFLGGGDTARVIAATNEMDLEDAAQNTMSSVLFLFLELSESPTELKKGESMYVIPKALQETKSKQKTQEEINRELWKSILKEDPLVGPHWQTQEQGGMESDGSDYEDMDVRSRIVPKAQGVLLMSEGDNHESSDHSRILTIEGRDMNLPKEQRVRTTAHEVEEKIAELLNVLRSHQYWDENSIISGNKIPVENLGLNEAEFDIQDSTYLYSTQQSSMGYILSKRIPIMDEIDIINEVLLLLLGLPTVLFQVQGQKINYSTKVAVSHLSLGALGAILEPFMESAKEIMELRAAVDKICSAPVQEYGKVIQTLASAIHFELLDLKAYLADKQKQYQRHRKSYKQRTASLIELHATMSGKLAAVRFLLQFLKDRQFYALSSSDISKSVCTYATDVLSSLYDNICTFELCGDNMASTLLFRLFQQSIRPFFINLGCWLSGEPLDSKPEFLVQMASNVDLFSNEFWSNGCYVQSEVMGSSNSISIGKTVTYRIVPCFLSEESINQIVYTGKAIRIVQALMAEETFIAPAAMGLASKVYQSIFGVQSPIGTKKQGQNSVTVSMNSQFPYYHAILALQYRLTDDASLDSPAQSSNRTVLDTKSPAPDIDFQWRMQRKLADFIEEQYQSTNSILKSTLFTHSRLMWHLKGMVDFYFMVQGEVMHSFSTIISRKMISRRPWYDSYILEQTFDHVASQCGWKHTEFVKIRINNGRPGNQKVTRTHLSALQLQILDQIMFEYQLPWPLAGIIYSAEDAKRMYGRITCLLLQVKTAKHTMELISFFKSNSKPSPELNLFWKLRLRFLSTVNDIWSYLMMTVLDAQIKKFMSEIEGQGDVDDMIYRSQRFITVCFERCFLKERTAPLHRSLLTMLNLAVKFSALLSSFICDQEVGSIRQQQTVLAAASAANKRMDQTNWIGRGGRGGVRVDEDELSTGLEDEEDNDSYEGESEFLGVPAEQADKRKKLSSGDNDYDSIDGHDKYGVGDEVIAMALASTLIPAPIPAYPPRKVSHAGKKQKTGSVEASEPQDPQWNLLIPSSSYKDQLEVIEHEFDRCREFLAESLRIIVRSNAARGNANCQRQDYVRSGERRGVGGGEGDSNYLDGLILALSSKPIP
ncbi:hypothetical protein BX616_004501 [Lobosporangium transversale]|uniref:Spc98 family-domain-containing protein n=1 Tax=Lobosporangium transversale TaxID=64571 RepID=A0A1Y2GAU4_9FUNG|nr:Spc98 family-domain-containing protein [Lobosporangium transversale]KAF9916146.1 hypothetical protein BX616_004501 [Lobosporangium transversale]ORZ05678.1 Spc98 family-domain-containing protein [Lobosporangium transversale]|eukprot:XP_021877165.1 Spc98 family-domain-containing protein [Lobosporangium transversale]